jgi:hypothetical protein
MPDYVRDSGRGDQNLLHSVARLAAKRFSVVSLVQLLAIGLTYDQVRGLVERGFLYPLHRGIFAVGHPKVGPWGHLMAAFLACGPDSFLSHRTAAAARGLREIATKRIEVTIPGGTARSGLVVHRAHKPPHPADVTTINGIRVSSFSRMLVEHAATERASEMERLITLAARKKLLRVDAVEAAIERHARRPGVGKLKRAFRYYRPGPDRKSELERTFDRAIESTDIPPPLRNVKLDGVWELDCYWPEYGLVVELDGRPYHIAVRDIEKDKFKDAKLLTKGIQTMRITDFRIEYDLAGVLDDVRAVINLRRPPAGS